jgi:predicted DNA-binding ArsR family transcriptional regulator
MCYADLKTVLRIFKEGSEKRERERKIERKRKEGRKMWSDVTKDLNNIIQPHH